MVWLVAMLHVLLFAIAVVGMVVAVRTLPFVGRGQRRPGLLVGLLGWLGAVAGPLGSAVVSGVEYLLEWGSLGDGFFFDWLTISIFAFGVALGWVGWRADPSLGRARCRRCWYDLTGAPSARCPECGYEARRAGDLFKTRASKPVVAAAGVVLLAGVASLRMPSILEHGWAGGVPTTPMIVAMPWLPEHLYFDSSASLWDRHYDDSMWAWQAWLLEGVCRATIEHSTDYRAIDRATDLVVTGDGLTLGIGVIRRLFTDVLSEDYAASLEASDYIDSWRDYFPKALPEELRAEFGPLAIRAVKTGSPELVEQAAPLALVLGVPADEVALAVIGRVDEAADEDARNTLMSALDDLASDNDVAFAHLLMMARSDDPVRRAAAMRPAGTGSRGDIIYAELEASLAFEDDTVVLAAARAMVNSCSCKQPCDERERLLAVADARPAIHDEIVEALVRRGCDGDDVAARLAAMIGDADIDRAVQGVGLAWHLDERAGEFLPVLEASRARLAAAGKAEDVDRAIAWLKAQVEETQAPEMVTPDPE